MIALLFTLLSLILPNIYAQDEQKYNPTSDAFDNLVYTLLPLFVISAYNGEGRMKVIISIIEAIIGISLLLFFLPLYNFFVHKGTSKFDYVWMVSTVIFALSSFSFAFLHLFVTSAPDVFKKNQRRWWGKFIYVVVIIGNMIGMISFVITFAIYWIKINDISEKIGYEWFIVVSAIIILIIVILCLFGRPYLALYFYLVASVGLSFSIGYSNNEFFTKLSLAIMSYFLGRMFDKEVIIGKTIKQFDDHCFKRIDVKNKMMLRFYIDEADKDRVKNDDIINFYVNSDDKVEVVCDDNITNRIAYYLHDICKLSSSKYLFVQLNKGDEEKYSLDELKKGVLVQTPKLNGIILTMVLLDDDNYNNNESLNDTRIEKSNDNENNTNDNYLSLESQSIP